MLMQPIDKISENQSIEITLSFANGESMDAQFVVKKNGSNENVKDGHG